MCMLKNLLITGAHQQKRVDTALMILREALCLVGTCTDDALCKNCQRIVERKHPNITYIEAESEASEEKVLNPNREIKVQQVKAAIVENQKSNCEDGPAFIVISEIERLNKSAANALLKSIEDCGTKKAFIGLAPSRASILPTLASRFIQMTVRPSLALEIILNQEIALRIKQISEVKPQNRWPFCATFKNTKNELIEDLEIILDNCQAMLHSRSLDPLLAVKIGDALTDALEKLSKNNNPKLVIDYLLFNSWPYTCP
jgi:DNA polymerase III gamma/tau subunit